MTTIHNFIFRIADQIDMPDAAQAITKEVESAVDELLGVRSGLHLADRVAIFGYDHFIRAEGLIDLRTVVKKLNERGIYVKYEALRKALHRQKIKRASTQREDSIAISNGSNKKTIENSVIDMPTAPILLDQTINGATQDLLNETRENLLPKCFNDNDAPPLTLEQMKVASEGLPFEVLDQLDWVSGKEIYVNDKSEIVYKNTGEGVKSPLSKHTLAVLARLGTAILSPPSRTSHRAAKPNTAADPVKKRSS